MLHVVNAERLGRLARMLRVRQRLTQVALAARSGVSRRAVSILERGLVRQLKLEVAEAIIVALGGRIDVRLLWNGPELDQLLDEGHASLGAAVKRRLERWGWLVKVEVSYSQWGERGRIDLLAFHPATHILLVIELKTMLVDVQALLGTLDAKARLARAVSEQFGWEVLQVVPAIVFLDDQATRARLRKIGPLFDRYSVRGRAAVSWCRRPDVPASGLLWFAGGSTPSRHPGVGRRVYPRHS